MKFNNIFITVGTTQFDALIRSLSSPKMASVLRQLQCKNLTIQIGHGHDSKTLCENLQGINIEVYRLKHSIIPDIIAADLVISHAGAGSCLEILNSGTPAVVVINEDLMGNHQKELAEQLASEGYLVHCTPSTLHKTLLELNVEKLHKYQKGNVERFVEDLDELCGF